jgi:HK97 family phage major capsid protein
MIRNLNIIKEHRQSLLSELQDLDRVAGERALNPSEQGRWDRLTAEMRNVDRDIADVEAEQASYDRAAQSRARSGFAIGGPTADPWESLDVRRESPEGLRRRAHDVIDRSEALSEQGREALTEAVQQDHTAAAIVAARANPAYETAFAKILANPERGLFTLTPQELAAVQTVESARASMATTTGTAGYLIPLSLDPNVILSNAGATNPIRSLATVKQVAASPHRAITSAGITGAWVAEATAIGDKSPAFVGVDLDLHKMAMWITGSYEILQDAAKDLASILPPLLADARDRLEADAFTIGSGSGAPFGVVTDLAAASAFVTATTRGSFTSASSGDVLSLLNAQTPRTRQSTKTAWVMNNAHLSTIRQQTVGTAGSLLMDLADDGNLLGHPVFEASAMDSASTSGSYLAVLADFSKYLIADHVGGPSLEYVQNVVNGDGIPTGQRGWIYWHRTSGKLLDTTAGKILKA